MCVYSRGTILSQWNRNYFFTQGGNLMQQSKGDFGGQLCIDLEGCAVAPSDVDDRRRVFQVGAAAACIKLALTFSFRRGVSRVLSETTCRYRFLNCLYF